LLGYYLERELDELTRQGVRLLLIGDHRAFGPQLVERLERAVERTAANDRLTLVVALNYGARGEIANAARALALKAKAGDLDPATIDEASFGSELTTAGLPELDLIIRTSGEKRLSNFLLWQAAYAELLFIDTLWPDFDEDVLKAALDEFAGRQRRFGGR
jgi:undecaprenyl diphosphate synthase